MGKFISGAGIQKLAAVSGSTAAVTYLPGAGILKLAFNEYAGSCYKSTEMKAQEAAQREKEKTIMQNRPDIFTPGSWFMAAIPWSNAAKARRDALTMGAKELERGGGSTCMAAQSTGPNKQRSQIPQQQQSQPQQQQQSVDSWDTETFGPDLRKYYQSGVLKAPRNYASHAQLSPYTGIAERQRQKDLAEVGAYGYY